MTQQHDDQLARKVAQLERELAAMRSSPQASELLRRAITVLPVSSAARTGGGTDGELSMYRSGATLVLQAYDAEGGAWRSVTLS